MLRWLKRLRTSRGFGVHSPLAFKWITRVVCDPGAVYYATAGLPDAASRRWLRVAAHIGAAEAMRLGAVEPRIDRAFALAGIRLSERNANVIVAVGADAELPPLPAEGVCVLIDFPSERVDLLIEQCGDKGVIAISDHREHYLLLRPDLTTARYEVAMR